jgi:PBP1b-binding outer membrane lipoprotein LpoB
MKKLTRLAVVATFALLLRASVQAQNSTPVSSTTPNGTAATAPVSNSDTTSQSSTTPQENSNKTALKTNKKAPKAPKNSSKDDSGPRYGRNQTVLR